MDLVEKVIQTLSIFKGKVIELQVQTVALPNGKQAKREIIRHHGAVGVIAIYQDKLVLVRQWRAPLNQVTLEIPAGKIELDETDVQTVAVRELNEETGLKATSLEQVASFYTSPGFADEKMTLFFADKLQPLSEKRPLDDDEFLNVVYLTAEQVQQAITSGQICDAKTLLAIQYWQLKGLSK